jgi:thymidylate synthase
MNKVDQQYLTLLEKILKSGTKKTTRNDDGTLSLFGETMRFDLREGFPILTTKKIHFKSIVHELLWMLSGSTNIKYLVDNNISIWTLWPFNKYSEEQKKIAEQQDLFSEELLYSYPELTMAEYVQKMKTDDKFAQKWGDIGEGGYGKLFRDFNGYDQITEVFKSLKKNPFSRRNVISLWNPPALKNTLLPCCHHNHVYNCVEMTTQERREYMFRNWEKYGIDYNGMNPETFEDDDMDDYNVPKIRLNLFLSCRSQDVLLGTAFNITQYALLLSLFAHCLNYDVGELMWSGVDCHLYSNHKDAASEQLKRIPFNLPSLKLNSNVKHILDFKYEDIELANYQSHPAIKAEVSL